MTSVQASPGPVAGRGVGPAVTEADGGRDRRDARIGWWVCFCSAAAVFTSWALAFPILAGPDEGPHAARAAAAARGQLTGPVVAGVTDVMLVRVPEAYTRFDRAPCFQPSAFNPRPVELTPRCAPGFRGGRRLVEVGTYEFRGFPLSYAVLGLPSLITPDRVGMYLMRLLGALVAAWLFAGALASARATRSPPTAVLGVLVAVTPMAWHLAGQVNPSAWEILAATCLWATLAAMARRDPAAPGFRRLVHRGGFALVVLAGTRPFGPAFAAVALAATAGLTATPWRRTVWRDPAVRTWLAVGGALTAAHAAWLLGFGLHHPTDRPGRGLLGTLGRFDDFAREAVGLLGINAIPVPRPVLWLWLVVAVALVALGVATAPARGRVVIAGVAAVGGALTVGADGFNLPPIGFDWQGRYGLPLYAGVPILAGALADPAPLGRLGTRLARSAIVLLLAAQVAAFVAAARRVGLGAPRGWNPFDYLAGAPWAPPLPAGVLLAAFVAATAALGWALLSPMPPGRGAARR